LLGALRGRGRGLGQNDYLTEIDEQGKEAIELAPFGLNGGS